MAERRTPCLLCLSMLDEIDAVYEDMRGIIRTARETFWGRDSVAITAFDDAAEATRERFRLLDQRINEDIEIVTILVICA